MRDGFLLLVVAASLGACGGATAHEGGGTTPAAHETAAHETAAHETAAHETAAHETAAHETGADVAPPAPWATMDHDARRAHMAQHVLPRAGELFTSWDEARYGDTFSCTTCHGEDAQARAFAMPNPALPVLYATGTIGQEEVLAQYTEACTFMYSRLVPSMQTMLGAETFDAETGRGFTCFSCHPRAADDDPRSQPVGARP